jgi:F-type H+-transporting ATPase subunit epsilon
MSLHCVVVTPESTLVDAKADIITLQLFDGEAGIMPGHAPIIGRLGYGELKLKTKDRVESYFIDGGFVQVLNDAVTVLTDRAVPTDSITVEEAAASFEEAKAVVGSTDADHQRREQLFTRARVQQRIVGKK